MSNLRKLFFVAVSIMTVFGVVGFVPMGAKAATAGSLIKMAGNSAVYYFDGTKRYVFPQENVYKSWYKDFSGVQTIAQSELQSYPIGGNVTMRPGTWMVKITTDPKVYAVTPGGVLHWVDSETRATTLWGANWNKMIVDVSDAFFVNYTTGTALTSNTHPDGTVIMRGGQYYYVMGGNERPFASEAALAANMINTAFAVTTTMDYPDGSSITGAETAITNVAGSSSNVGTSAAGLTVSAGTMTASTSLPKGANSVKVGTWNFAAGPEGAVTLNSVTFKRTGVGNTTDIANAYVYDGANRLTSGRTFNTSTNDSTFTLNLSIPAGSTKALSLYVSLATTAASGNEHVFGIESATAVSSNAASVNGVFPINSNKHSIAGATAGEVAISKTGSLSDPRVGDKGAKVSEFKLSTSSSEDVWVSQISLTQGGNISNSALSNFVLKQNGAIVSTASSIASNDRLDLVFTPTFKIEKGNNRTFELYADITGRPDDTIRFYIDDSADLQATGGTYGVGVNADIVDDNDSSGVDPDLAFNSSSSAHQLSLDGGQFTITFSGPSSQNISNASSDVVIWKGAFYSANEVEVRNVRFTIADTTDSAAIDLVDSADNTYDSGETVYIQDIKLWNLDNNTVIAGPVELAVGGSAISQNLVLTEDFTMTAGQTMNVGLSVDVRNTPGAGITLKATLGDGTTYSFGASDIKNVGSNTYLSNGSVTASDIVPSSLIAGNVQTVTASQLTVSVAPSPADHTLIKGTTSSIETAFNFAAGAGSAVKVNSVTVTAGTSPTDDNEYGASGAADTDAGPETSTSVGSLILSAKLMDGTTQLGLSKSFSSGVATFDNLNWSIPASQTKKLDVVITTNSAATLSATSDFLRLSLGTSSVNAVDAEGNTVGTLSGLPANEAGAADVLVTVKNSGSLSAAVAPTPTNPSAKLIAGGSTDVVVAAYRFSATDESFNVRKFQLHPMVSGIAAATNNGRIGSLKVRYPTQSSGTETRTVGISSSSDIDVDISDKPMYVAQNGNATLEVIIDAATFSLLDGSESGDLLGFQLEDTSATTLATGSASNQDVVDFGTEATGAEHMFVRTVLTVAAGSGTPNNTQRTRSASQKVASWNFSAGSTSNAFLRLSPSDTITVHVSGNLIAGATTFDLKDSSGTVRATGSHTVTAGEVTAGSFTLDLAPSADIEISTTALALDVVTNTVTLVAAAADTQTLSVSISTGTTSSAGDILWYDNGDSAAGNNMTALTVVNPVSTTIDFSNTYD